MNPVHEYHELSKHRLDRYASGPNGLDWATQPDPFRRFAGAPLVDLPLLDGELPARWSDLSVPDKLPPYPMALGSLAHLLQLSLGLSAWKSYGHERWPLRCNPSSGNLHPTEGYLICPNLQGLAAGVYHYRARSHRLERRAAAPFNWRGGVLLALTGIHWREAWKYGVRAFRYCQHDCGHALAAVCYAASALGWRCRLLGDWSDAEIAALTRVDRPQDFRAAEPETPEAIAWIGPGDAPEASEVLAALAGASWSGQANTLSRGRRDWPEIERVAEATNKPRTQVAPAFVAPALPPRRSSSTKAISELIRRRRSAQAFDGASPLGAEPFFEILDGLLPRPDMAPWSLLETVPAVHLILFVHRVEGIPGGVYCLLRDPKQLAELRASMRSDWLWSAVPSCPSHIPLYMLAPLDVRSFARVVSCHQDIASDSAFSLAMLARFDDIDAEHAWRYRHRFWEAGMLGQVLYLEAEAAGIQGTGIGCYFDDAVHEALGLEDPTFQDIYHFTVGTALVDTRLRSDPPYRALSGQALE